MRFNRSKVGGILERIAGVLIFGSIVASGAKGLIHSSQMIDNWKNYRDNYITEIEYDNLTQETCHQIAAPFEYGAIAAVGFGLIGESLQHRKKAA